MGLVSVAGTHGSCRGQQPFQTSNDAISLWNLLAGETEVNQPGPGNAGEGQGHSARDEQCVAGMERLKIHLVTAWWSM